MYSTMETKDDTCQRMLLIVLLLLWDNTITFLTLQNDATSVWYTSIVMERLFEPIVSS